MLNADQLLHLYNRIRCNISFIKCVNEKDMKQAIKCMHKIYQGSTNNLSKNLNCLTDFNAVAYRCAYLFKYAPFHTALAYKAMSHALTENPYEFQAALDSLSGPLKLCSLGGGPGPDVIGVIAAIHDKFDFHQISAKLVDIMSEWELTFSSVVQELRFGEQFYGSLSENVSEKWFAWSFITADLQSKMSEELIETLRTADIITMVKFVSAAACKETSNMIEKIFRIMKPGAFLLFVDNAGGGFEKLISCAAIKYKLNAIFKPLKHQHYINEDFINMKYGYTSCYESIVAVQLLMKSVPMNYSNEIHPAVNSSYETDFPLSPVPHYQKVHVPQIQNFRIGLKSVDKHLNDLESFETGSQFNWHENNISTKMGRFESQIDWAVGLNKSFESDSFWSSSLHTPTSQNCSVWDQNRMFDLEYQNDSFGLELPLKNFHYSNSNKIDSLHQDYSPKLHNSKVYPEPVDNHLSEYNTFKHKLLPKFQANSFSSDFSPDFSKAHIGYSEIHSKSFESELPWNLSFDSTPQTSPFQSKSLRTVNQVYDSYENELIECKDSWKPANNSSLLSTNNSLLPTPVFTNNSLLPTPSSLVYNSGFNITAADDSGYLEESFESELPHNSPGYSSPQHFSMSQRLVKFPTSKRKIVYSPHEIESFGKPSINSLTQHSTPLHHKENSLLSRTLNWQLLNKKKTPKVHAVSVKQHKSYKLARLRPNHSKNRYLSLQPSPYHLGKKKALKRYGNVSRHRHKPYKLKRHGI